MMGDDAVFSLDSFPSLPREQVTLILSRLTKNRKIARLAAGVYGKSRNSRLFGKLNPSSSAVFALLEKQHEDRWSFGGISLFHSLGLTEQNPVVITVLNNKSNYKKRIGMTADSGGAVTTIHFRRISAPITAKSKPVIEFLEVIGGAKEGLGQDINNTALWLWRRLAGFQHKEFYLLFEFLEIYYPKWMMVVIKEMARFYFESRKEEPSIKILLNKLDALVRRHLKSKRYQTGSLLNDFEATKELINGVNIDEAASK